MSHKALVSSALATALLMGLGAPMAAQAQGKEKCYGIAKAGANDCANLSGSHSCAGQSKTTGEPEEWNYVPAGSCKMMKGMSAAEAKAKMGKS